MRPTSSTTLSTFVMKTLLQIILTAVPVAATSSWITSELQEPVAQEPGKAIHEMSEMEVMELMMKMGAPGEEHKQLAKSAGKWDVTMGMRMSPDAPWEYSKGSSKITMIMGGRYMVEQTTFEMMGMETKGMLVQGFDNLSKKYQTMWIDSFGTRMMLSEGERVGKDQIVYRGTMKDFVTPEGRPYKYVITEKSDDHTIMEMYDTIPETPEAPMPKEPNVVVMKMEYKRAAE
ncbi:MAG: hypothetical protein CMJ94_09140 [Planctomycetes bacterium]|nr:hypothetical protein [Planctomycetota bacterium]